MAAEFSRELSIKVFVGQRRLVRMGFRQGGPAGYGLRRYLIGENGEPKGELSRKQHKSIQTDRVILVPGPSNEIEVVHDIYRQFVHDRLNEVEIAIGLNRRGIATDTGRPWSRGTVHQILINEKYVGNNVWNRGSFKLKQRRVKNDPDLWIRANSVFEPIVERALFDAAQQIIQNRSRKITNDEMLRSLRELLVCAGSLSGLIIDEAEGCPSSSVYRSRFGNLLRAYQLVGYTPHRDYRYIEINRALRRFYPDVIADVIQGIENAGGVVVRNSATEVLEINGEFSASVVIARCRETVAGAVRWKIRLDRGLMPDVTIVVRMNRENILPFDYLILPSLDMNDRVLRIQEHNGITLDSYRFDSLDRLFEMAERISLKDAA